MKIKGFTLIELLVVIVVIVFITSALVPSLAKAKILARRGICANRMKLIHYAAILYANDDQNNRLPQGGYHTESMDLDDGVGMMTHEFFKLSSYITSVPNLPTDYETYNSMSVRELSELAMEVADDPAAGNFVCPSIQRGDETEYPDYAFRERRTFKTVIYSPLDYARIGYHYLAGFETEDWDFDQQGAVTRGIAEPWNSPSTTADNGSCVLATDKTRHIPAGTEWVNTAFIQAPHGKKDYELYTPLLEDFDYTTKDIKTNILTLDGAVKYKKLSDTKARQMFHDNTGGGINHEDYTFF